MSLAAAALAAALQALYPGLDAKQQTPAFTISWTQAKPGRRPDTVVVLAGRASRADATTSAELAVLEKQGASFRVRARRAGWEGLDGPAALPDRDHDAVVGLDLAPFELRPGEFAIGVVTEHQNTGNHGAETTRALELFREDAGRLVSVLSVPTKEESESDQVVSATADDMDVRSESQSRSSVIVMLKTLTAGFFDLNVRVTDASDPAHKNHSTRRYRWAGARYEPAGS